MEIEQGGVGLAHQQVAVALDGGDVAELAAGFGRSAALAEAHTLGFQQRLIEGGEVEALAPILLGAHIARATHQFGFGDIAQLLDLGQELTSGQHACCPITTTQPYPITGPFPSPSARIPTRSAWKSPRILVRLPPRLPSIPGQIRFPTPFLSVGPPSARQAGVRGWPIAASAGSALLQLRNPSGASLSSLPQRRYLILWISLSQGVAGLELSPCSVTLLC